MQYIIDKIKRIISTGPSNFNLTQYIVLEIAKEQDIKLTDEQIYYIIAKSTQIEVQTH